MVGGGAAAPIPPPKGEGGERSEPGGVRAASDGASDILKCKTHRGLVGEIVRIEGARLVARTPPGRALRARPPSPFGGGISKAARRTDQPDSVSSLLLEASQGSSCIHGLAPARANRSMRNGATGRLGCPPVTSSARIAPTIGPSANPCAENPKAWKAPALVELGPITGMSSGMRASMPAQQR